MSVSGKLAKWIEREESDLPDLDTLKRPWGMDFGTALKKDDLREELRTIACKGIEREYPEKENVVSLARQFYYYVCEVRLGRVMGKDIERTVQMSPNIATTLAFRYLEKYLEAPDGNDFQLLEEELLDRLLQYVAYSQRKYLMDHPSVFESRRKKLAKSLSIYEKRLNWITPLYSKDDNLSFGRRWYAWWHETRIQQLYSRMKARYEQFKRSLKRWESLTENMDRFSQLEDWLEVREERFVEAKDEEQFVSRYESLRTEQGEVLSQLEKAQENIRQQSDETDSSSDEEESTSQQPAQKNGHPKPKFPSCLEVKDRYSDEEMEEIFRLVNQKEIRLEDQRANIRSKLIAGDIQGAVRHIRRELERNMSSL